MASIGAGLGSVVGSGLALSSLQSGQSAINQNVANTETQTAPFVGFGTSEIPNATQGISNVESVASQGPLSYQQFGAQYTNTPAAQYQLQQADAVQNSSAAAQGQLLSGANERALATDNAGIVAQNENTAYNEYLAGNNQQFGQLETSLGNMFQAIGVGTTATGQDVSLTNAQNTATEANAQAQATANTNKGTGIGQLLGGAPAAATKIATTF